MSWSNVMRYGSHIIKGHGDENEDSHLPLLAKIGSLLKMQVGPFLRAAANCSLIKEPTETDAIIRSISHIKLDIDGEIYRYFITAPDAENKAFLQVFVNAKGEVADIVFYTQLDTIIPETVEEQDLFTGTGKRGLGDRVFYLTKDQLASVGVSDTILGVNFAADADSIQYTRDVGESDYMPPFQGIEVRIDDAKGQNGIEQTVYFMPYTRPIGPEREFLMITTSVLKSVNGKEKNSISVDFMIGIPIELSRVVVQ